MQKQDPGQRRRRGKATSLAAALCLTLAAFDVHGAARVRVVDGDTIEVAGVTHRLHGIDAPEAGQECELPRSGTWRCGQAAIAFLEDMVDAGDVNCEARGEDGYGRALSVCEVGGQEINRALVLSGNAWAFRKYSSDYVAEEVEARRNEAGVWRARTMPPWEYRARRWKAAETAAPEGCPIKGNISDNGRIYHAPWSPWYGRTKVDAAKGERWFCSEAEAVAAGWRAPYWGG